MSMVDINDLPFQIQNRGSSTRQQSEIACYTICYIKNCTDILIDILSLILIRAGMGRGRTERFVGLGSMLAQSHVTIQKHAGC
jgi:hypothetical protein